MNTALYRLQINKQFTLDQAKEQLPYFHDLGFDGVYCSPFCQACSEHGYDITDPNRVSPDVGDFDGFCDAAHQLGMKVMIDVVPNHMGFFDGKNVWWQDVLKNGRYSKYAHFFDIDWNPLKPELQNKVLLPLLTTDYGSALNEIEMGDGQLVYRGFPLPINGEMPKERTPEAIHEVLERQHYRLAHWRVAAHEINYRRFFNIHELVALRIELDDVLEAHHKWVFEQIARGKVDGLRIDHPDGLYDPAAYFKKLRARHTIFTVVEKILDRDEELPHWEVEGTVGYEYLNLLNGLFIESNHEEAFTRIYHDFVGEKRDLSAILLDSKRRFAFDYMASEVEQLSQVLDKISEQSWETRDFTRKDLTEVLTEVLAAFPVYRTYVVAGEPVSVSDERAIKQAIAAAARALPHREPAIFHFIQEILLTHPFTHSFQQLTGPLMAKGLEDTTFYRYNRFISLNEVGGDPAQFGYSLAHFHNANKQKLQKWPLGLLATSTHDSKRSEDARMRLNILSEMPAIWEAKVNEWRSLDDSLDRNTAYMLYQMVFAAWPRGGAQWPHFLERMWEIALKSVREAKEFTDWNYPNEEYEKQVRLFLERALMPGSLFLQSMLDLLEKVEPFAEKSSLSALAVKIASPGVVDVYQGNETWNYRLVDPDNRAAFSPAEESSKREFLKKLLRFRRDHPQLFLEGDYIPLESSHATIAFIRRTKREELLVLAGRFFASAPQFGKIEYSQRFRDVRSGHTVVAAKEIDVQEVLGDEPAVYLYAKTARESVSTGVRGQFQG